MSVVIQFKLFKWPLETHVLLQYVPIIENNCKFLVSNETVVLRRWERSKQKFGFIKRVDKGEITTVKDLESRFLAFQIFHGGNFTFINSFDKTKFLKTIVCCYTLNNSNQPALIQHPS